MSCQVELSGPARADLVRLHECLLQRAETREDLDAAERAIDAIGSAVATRLTVNPFICREAADGSNGRRRDLVIPFGRTGYVALCEVFAQAEREPKVVFLAVRHQRAEDYH